MFATLPILKNQTKKYVRNLKIVCVDCKHCMHMSFSLKFMSSCHQSRDIYVRTSHCEHERTWNYEILEPCRFQVSMNLTLPMDKNFASCVFMLGTFLFFILSHVKYQFSS